MSGDTPAQTPATTEAATAPSAAKPAKAPRSRKQETAAGPAPKAKRAPAPKRAPADNSYLDRMSAVIVASLEDDKAEQIVALDLMGRAAFADRMIIATGLADRQISAMATHLEQKLHEAGMKRVQIEGANGTDWMLIDAGDIVVHLFKPDARALYDLEKMWGPDLDDIPAETTKPASGKTAQG